MNLSDTKSRGILLEIFQAALAAVAPGPAMARALRGEPAPDRVWLIALGKAAHPMVRAAVRVVQDGGREPAGGLVVAAHDAPRPHPAIPVLVGDHPEPGPGSLAAAAALEALVTTIPRGDTVLVLLSGGTTSLVGAPQPGIPPRDLTALYAHLLRSGLDIKAMNTIRKRFTRWGGGRLARSLSHAAAVRCYIVSDVIGDDLAAIASGPCVPDPSTVQDVEESLVRAGLWQLLPSSIAEHVAHLKAGYAPETPKPGDPIFDRIEHQLIATNRLALDGAAGRTRELGLMAEIVEAPLQGEAGAAGARIAQHLIADQGNPPATEPTCCRIFGGETTVTIENNVAGVGGRCQELALAAARTLRHAGPQVALLAAGTDGRDGPTDAAGAVVDAATWNRIAAANRNPEADLQHHESYAALATAGALIKTGPTGTNVMDVVVGIR